MNNNEKEKQSEKEEDIPPVVFKTIGAPGTGKTTRVVGNPDIPESDPSLVQQNINEGYKLNDIFICTYTNAGVDEAEERLYKILDEPKTAIQDRVSTIHSQCFSTLGLSRDQVVGWWDKKKFCDRYNLQFQGGDNEDDIMSGDKPEGNSFYDIYSWLKSNRKDIDEYQDCPQPWNGSEGFPWLAERWEEYKDERNLTDFSDMIEQVVEMAAMQLENMGLGVLFPDQDTTTKHIFLEARNDPNRDPDVIRGKGAFIDSKVLFVDEVQDLNPLQWEWYLAQKLVMEKVYIGGDDDQCLPPNAPIEVKGSPTSWENEGKEFQKPIKDVNVGDLIRTLTSNGKYSYRRVSHVKKKEADEKTFRTIRTESDNLTDVTNNHKMLSRIPESEHETQKDKYYIYLMRDNEERWRIGETDNLRQRLNVERGARCIVPLASFNTKEKALEKETEWSLNYSIPQITIQQRDGEVLSDPEIRERLYDSVSPQYDLIERDFGVFLDNPPLYKKSTTRGQTKSVNINIKKCADMRGDKPRHSFNVQTSNEDIKEVLRDFSELTEGESGSGSTRFRTTSTNYSELGDLAEEVSTATGGDIITVMSPTEERSTATITPAGNLVEGMLVPVATDGEVNWEEIIEINDRKETTEVYDLTVPGTHNFTTGGVGVSNTIYGWAGADPNFMLDEEGDFEVLDKTYRIPEKVWETCDGVIKQVGRRQEKKVEPHGEGGDVHVYRNPMPSEIMTHIHDTEESVFMLFRARYMINNYTEKLHEAGIPYTNMSTFETWSDNVVTLRDALDKIDRYKRTKDDSIRLSGDEVQVMMDCSESHMINKGNGLGGKEKAMANWGGVQIQDIDDIFTKKVRDRNGDIDYRLYLSAIEDNEEINYYQKQAIKGSIRKGTTDLYPDKVRIGTIHSSKGREAETVILALDSTDTIIENMMEDTRDKPEKHISDAERRVYYVGMTRTSDTLVLAQNMTAGGVSLDADNMLGDRKEQVTESGTRDGDLSNYEDSASIREW